jgi:hypothetical protein
MKTRFPFRVGIAARMLLVLVVSIVVLPRISGCECAAPILPPLRHEISDFELCFGLLVVAPSMCAKPLTHQVFSPAILAPLSKF